MISGREDSGDFQEAGNGKVLYFDLGLCFTGALIIGNFVKLYTYLCAFMYVCYIFKNSIYIFFLDRYWSNQFTDIG